jgi:hypothetical protein
MGEAMNWSKSYANKEELYDSRADHVEATRAAIKEENGDRALEQFTIALDTAHHLISATIPDDTDCRVTLNGHANPEPGPGDAISISVTRK